MGCSPYDLRDYFFGELSHEEHKAVDRHVASCAACREELENLRLTQSTLLSVREEEPPRRIAFVSDPVFEPSWWQRLWRSGPALGFASAAMLSAAILVHAFVPRPPAIAAPVTAAIPASATAFSQTRCARSSTPRSPRRSARANRDRRPGSSRCWRRLSGTGNSNTGRLGEGRRLHGECSKSGSTWSCGRVTICRQGAPNDYRCAVVDGRLAIVMTAVAASPVAPPAPTQFKGGAGDHREGLGQKDRARDSDRSVSGPGSHAGHIPRRLWRRV